MRFTPSIAPPSQRIRPHLRPLLFMVLLALLQFACDADTKSVGLCGDGFADPTEQCDGNDFGGATCGTLGHYDTGGQLTCKADCTLDTTHCGGYCGDGVLQLMYAEDCEGDDLNNATCRTEGFHGGVLLCGDNCRFDTSMCTGLGNQRPSFTTTPSPSAQENTQYIYSTACSDPDGDDVTITVGASDTCGGAFSSAGGSGVYSFTPTEQQGGTSCTLHLSCADPDITEHQMQVISIQEVNLAPAIANLPAAITAPWALPTEFDVTADDPDLPPNMLTYELTASTCSFNAAINTYGRVAFTCPAQNVTCDLTIRVTDNGAPAMSDTGHLTITCANLDPTFTSTPATILDEHQEYVYEVTCNDPDGHTVTLTRGADTCGGTYTPVTAGRAVYAFTPGEDRGGTSCDVVFYCTDTWGTVSQTASFDIAETNSLPLFDNLPGTATALWGRAGAFTAFAHDIDTPAQTFTYGVVSTTCAFPVAVDPYTGDVSWTCGDPGVCTATLSATDALGGVSTADLQIQCTNRAPVIKGFPVNRAKLAQENVINIFCKDPDYDARTFELTAAHTCGGTITNLGSGFAQLRFNPNNAQQGVTCTLGVRCRDNHSNTELVGQVKIDPLWKVAAGGQHMCGIFDGRLYCYGENEYGQLGINSTQDKAVFTEVEGNHTNWSMVSAGYRHSCGIRDGRLYCWGWNTYGQLGDNTVTQKNVPTEVAGAFSDWSAITLGANYSCGLRGGRAFCWGFNNDGQLGNGTTTHRLVPTEVSGAYTDWSMLSARSSGHVCGVRVGRLYCWGNNADGQLGIGSTTSSLVPVEVSGSYSSWSTVATGANHTCAIRDNRLYCWGDNSMGQLGDSSTIDRLTPIQVSGGNSDWTAVSAGGGHTCAIRSGRLFCWGSNSYGQIGDSTNLQKNVPTEVTGSHTDWVSIESFNIISSGIRAGELFRWGMMSFYTGQSISSQNFPIQLSNQRYTSHITQGESHYCFLSNGKGICGGTNNVGANNIGTSDAWYTVQVAGPANTGFSCGLTAGRIYCWGGNGSGQLGDGTYTNRSEPTEIAGGFSDWEYLTVNTNYACAIRQGRRYCWGANNYGQIGNDSVGNVNFPTEYDSNNTGWEVVSAGSYHACGIRNGRAYCWGQNDTYGKLGIGTSTSAYVPTEVVGGYDDWTDIAAGVEHTCGIRSGRAYCWGFNHFGQLGNGTNTSSQVPVLVSGGYTDWEKVIVNQYSDTYQGRWSCGIRSGRMYCWGNGYNEQLGPGSGNSYTPVQVSGSFQDWRMRTQTYWLHDSIVWHIVSSKFEKLSF